MEKEEVKVSVAVGTVIKRGGKYLMVQENIGAIKGLWGFPAGRVKIGESLEEAAAREAKEESGFDVELVRQIGIFHYSADEPVRHAFEAKIISGELKFPKDEIMDAKWFTYEEIKKMKDKLRRMWILDAISVLENQK